MKESIEFDERKLLKYWFRPNLIQLIIISAGTQKMWIFLEKVLKGGSQNCFRKSLWCFLYFSENDEAKTKPLYVIPITVRL